MMDSMNKLNPAKRTEIIAALVAGCSIRATCRMTGAAKGTVLRLLSVWTSPTGPPAPNSPARFA